MFEFVFKNSIIRKKIAIELLRYSLQRKTINITAISSSLGISRQLAQYHISRIIEVLA